MSLLSLFIVLKINIFQISYLFLSQQIMLILIFLVLPRFGFAITLRPQLYVRVPPKIQINHIILIQHRWKTENTEENWNIIRWMVLIKIWPRWSMCCLIIKLCLAASSSIKDDYRHQQ